MIDKRLQAYHKYKRVIKTVLTIGGCWYMPTKSGKFTYYWPVCVLLLMIMYLTFALHTAYVFRHKLVIMMKFIGVAISPIGAIIKVLTFMVNRRSLINNHRTLNYLFEEFMQNEKIRTIILSSLRATYILAYTYVIIMIATLLTYHLPSYLFIIRNLWHFHLTTNYTLPMSSKGYTYFWTVPDNFLRHLHLVTETTFGVIICMIACGVESLFGFFAYQLASTAHGMIFRITNPLPNEKFSDLLKTCIVKHQKLLQCRDILEKVYGPIVFWHIISDAVTLCTLIYDTTSTEFKFTFINVCVIGTYALIKLFQMFMYARYGTVLTNAGNDFRNGIYFSEWPNSDLDRHVRTNVILMMMQKPMTINAIFCPVEIVLFTNFVNTTMSYFFLLQSTG